MQQEITSLKKQVNQQRPVPVVPEGHVDPNVPFRRADISQYCWTHGACNHNSKKCRNKKKGHQIDATFENKKGGSELFCN